MSDVVACCEAVRRIATVDDKLEGYACPIHGTQWTEEFRWYLRNRSEMKVFEIRDRMTFIPAMGVRISGADDPLLWRAGFANEHEITYVLLMHLTRSEMRYDPFGWGDRTMYQAHRHIERNWSSLPNGAVVDVEYILNESDSPKRSEVTR